MMIAMQKDFKKVEKLFFFEKKQFVFPHRDFTQKLFTTGFSMKIEIFFVFLNSNKHYVVSQDMHVVTIEKLVI